MSSGGSPMFINGKDAKAQQARIRLQTFQGEFFLDSTLGIPYFGNILVKNPNILYIQSIFTDALTALGLVNVEVHGQYDKLSRQFTIAWQATDPDSSDQIGGIVG
jgi:hypothetical protein